MLTATVVAVCVAMLLPANGEAARPLPGPVGGVTAVAVPGGAEVTWRAPTGDRLRRIVVERRSAGKRVWTVAASLPVSRRSVRLALIPGQRTELRVRARNRFGFGRSNKRRVFVTALATIVPPKAEEPPKAADPPTAPTGTLPVMRIDTEGGVPIVDRENYIDGEWELDPLTEGGEVTSGELEIRGRGNMTWNHAPKKPYRLKLTAKRSMLGMKSSRHFALLADYFDRSHLRNRIAEHFASYSSLGWTPTLRHVEVVLNGSYLGLYTLIETVRLDDDRVPGDWLFEVDRRYEEEGTPQGFHTTADQQVVLKEPEEASSEEFNEGREQVQDFEDALLGDDFTDPENGYAAHIDVQSWIDWYLIEELMFNHDGYFSSTYMHVGEDEKLRMGPLWDHDVTFGTATGNNPLVWYLGTLDWHLWIARLKQDPDFNAAVRARWVQLRPMVESARELLASESIRLARAIEYDDALWGLPEWPAGVPVGGEEAIDEFLASRAAFFDAGL